MKWVFSINRIAYVEKLKSKPFSLRTWSYPGKIRTLLMRKGTVRKI